MQKDMNEEQKRSQENSEQAAAVREVEHVGSFYNELVESVVARDDANLKELLKEIADTLRTGEEY